MKKTYISLVLLLTLEQVVLAGGMPASELYGYGLDAIRGKNFSTAIEEFQEALYVDEKHIDSYKQLAHCYCKLRDYKQALATIHKAQSFFPLDPEFDKILSNIHMMKAVAKEGS